MEGQDKGWAWAVAFAALGINFIMAGMGRMSGILYVAFIDLYGVDRKGASTPFSVRASTRNLLGPVVGILGQKYGVQGVIVCGSILSTVSTAICFFSRDIVWITVLWGGFSGIGTALTTSLNQVVIGQYFKKYHTTAAGMGFSGGCVGSFFFPALIQWLLDHYGIGGTFLVISGIIMHTIPAALIMKKPSWLKKKPPDILQQVVERPSVNGEEGNSPDIQFLRRNSSLVARILTCESDPINGSLEITERDLTSVNETCILGTLEDMYSCLQLPNMNLSNGDRTKNNFSRAIPQPEDIRSVCTHKFRTFHLASNPRRDGNPNGNWTKRGSFPEIWNVSSDESRRWVLLRLKGLLDTDPNRIVFSQTLFPEGAGNKAEILRVVTELVKLYHKSQESNHPDGQHAYSHQRNGTIPSRERPSNSFWVHIKTAFHLFGNPLFLLICMSRTVHFMTFTPVVTTIVDFALDRGFREEEGIYVIGALSLGDLLGRLCLGWVTDRGFMDASRYVMVGMIVQGAITASLTLMPNRTGVYISLCVFGVLQGSLFVRHPVLVHKYISSHAHSIAMGSTNFFGGLLGLGLPAYIGYFRDTLGSYDYIFYINGAIGALVGLLWSLEPYFLRCRPSEGEHRSCWCRVGSSPCLHLQIFTGTVSK